MIFLSALISISARVVAPPHHSNSSFTMVYIDYDVAKQVSLEKLRPLLELSSSSTWPPKLGTQVEAFWKDEDEDESGDGNWFEAVIVNVIGGTSFEVYFSDYFSLASVDISQIRPISKQKVEATDIKISPNPSKLKKISRVKAQEKQSDKKSSGKKVSSTSAAPEVPSKVSVEKVMLDTLAPSATLDPSWHVGDICLAQWSADMNWYNAEIVAKDENGLFHVLFTDYGNEECGLPPDRVRSVSPLSQPSEEEFQQLTAAPSLSTCISSPAQPVWKVGDLCVAQWSEDVQWYDAKIIAKNEVTGLYHVLFTEYGNEEDGLSSERIQARTQQPSCAADVQLPTSFDAEFFSTLMQVAATTANSFNAYWGY